MRHWLPTFHEEFFMTMPIENRLVLLASISLLAAACTSDESGSTLSPDAAADAETSQDAESSPDAGTIVEQCDATRRPILFVHGIMGGGDNFELQAQRFTSNGYCRASNSAFDYDATYLAIGGAPQSATDDTLVRLDAAVDAFRDDSGFDTLDLVGHSYGTGISAGYLSDPVRAAKIEHYAQAAGGGLPVSVPQVNLSSEGDFVAGNQKSVASPGPDGAPADNPDIGYHDHVAVLTCKESFAAMYELFNGEPPDAPDVVPEDKIEVSGFYKNLSDNTPHPGVTIGIYELDPATGDRLNEKPDFEFVTGPDGSWGPFSAKPEARYEFFEPEAGEAPSEGEPGRPQHTYRGPFRRSTHLMYLKAVPILGSFAADTFVGKIPYTDSQTGFIVMHSHRAMISKADPGGHGSDSLTVNGSEVLTAEVAL
ncbi:MAG: hypothetical protein ABIK89_20695, partial [Planctomycetota bacterium]